MPLVARYIVRNVFLGFAAAAALLLPILGLLDLLEELEDVGEQRYTMLLALEVVFMTIPRRAVDMAPFVALLGGIVGLGQMAASRELTALRAAGVSMGRIAAAALAAGVALAATLAVADEFAASPLQQRAWELRAQALSTADTSRKGSTLWARRDGQLLRIADVRLGRNPVGIEIFRFADGDRLSEYIHAAYAEVRGDGLWELRDVEVKRWSAAGGLSERVARMPWQSILRDDRLVDLTMPMESLSPRQLYQQTRHPDATGERSSAYAMALWQRIGAPVLTLAMVLLAVPFAFAPARSAGQGVRLALGAVAGLLLYLMNQIVLNLGLVFALSPPLVGLVPPLLALTVAVLLVRRLN